MLGKIEISRLLIFSAGLLFCAGAPRWVAAAATTDVSVVESGLCSNGSAQMTLKNANLLKGINVVLAQTATVNGKPVSAEIKFSLARGETKALGCAVQKSPPQSNVQFTWRIQSAEYR